MKYVFAFLEGLVIRTFQHGIVMLFWTTYFDFPCPVSISITFSSLAFWGLFSSKIGHILQ